LNLELVQYIQELSIIFQVFESKVYYTLASYLGYKPYIIISIATRLRLYNWNSLLFSHRTTSPSSAVLVIFLDANQIDGLYWWWREQL